MASSSGEKSEKPTANKLRKAREKGDVARSKDLPMAVGMLTSFVVLNLCIPYYRHLISGAFLSLTTFIGRPADPSLIGQFLLINLKVLFSVIATLTVIPLTCIIASLIPGGWVFNLSKLKPDLKKISPLSGVKRIFSASHYVEVGKMIAKCALVLIVMYGLTHQALTDLIYLRQLSFMLGIEKGLAILRHVIGCVIAVIVLFAFIDLPLSRFMFNKKMRMTKQEVKSERKNSEGDPQIKGRIRQLQRQMAMGQIARTVAEADVVITNPTHYAVALRYDEKKAPAPYIVAKGTDDIALYIQEVACNHQVEIVTYPPLARAVYYTTRVKQQIPTQLFRAIAYILTYVMQLKAWRMGKTTIKPHLNRQLNIPREVLNRHGEREF